jgi:four helix bundle protein
MHNLEELQVYRKALLFTKVVRGTVKRFPKDEIFGLISQFKRASDSIVLNIAEGAGNSSNKEFIHFLDYSIRSSFECKGCLDIALENSFVEAEHQKLITEANELIAMLYGLQKYLRHKAK